MAPQSPPRAPFPRPGTPRSHAHRGGPLRRRGQRRGGRAARRARAHDVVGVHLRTGVRGGRRGRRAAAAPAAAPTTRATRAQVAARLGIPFYVVDVREAFAREVVAPFAAAYAAGRTPNPCVACNRGVKLGRLGELARGLRRRGRRDGPLRAHARRAPDGRVRLLRARGPRGRTRRTCSTRSRRSSCASRGSRSRASTKDEVRREARARGLPVAAKPDSQELCFVPDGDVRGWLRAHAPTRPCPRARSSTRRAARSAATTARRVHGRGQRRGLPPLGTPRYVLAVDPATAPRHDRRRASGSRHRASACEAAQLDRARRTGARARNRGDASQVRARRPRRSPHASPRRGRGRAEVTLRGARVRRGPRPGPRRLGGRRRSLWRSRGDGRLTREEA